MSAFRCRFAIAIIAALIASSAALSSNSKAAGEKYPFQDPTLPVNVRVADLVSRLTLEEKASMMNDEADGVPRLGIRNYFVWNEALHGVARLGKFTVFPQAAGMAATWDPNLIFQVGTAISDEAWGAINRGIKAGDTWPPERLLTFWSPTINMARDPRWGRTPETYGEDPYLTSRIALGFVTGLQGDDKKYIKTVSTPKHFAANNEEHNRLNGSATVSEKTLQEYYFPAFKATVQEGHAQSIMGAYNAINGIPCNANRWLITDVLKKQWGFDGFVVTDCGAPRHMIVEHKYAKDGPEAAAYVVNSGVSVECGDKVLPRNIAKAVEKGLLTEERVDEMMTEMLTVRMRLGMFDPYEMNPYSKIDPKVIGSEAHKNLARQVSRESIVLLKNSEQGGSKLLPLNASKIKSIAVLGPHANRLEYGDYSGDPANTPVTMLDAFKERLGSKVKINYVEWMPIPDAGGYPLIPAENMLGPDGKAGGFNAEFFSNSKLEGAPVYSRSDAQLVLTKVNIPEPVSFKNGAGDVSVRWTGKVRADAPGLHLFSVKAFGKASLFINGENVLEFDDPAPKKEKQKIKSGIGLSETEMTKKAPKEKLHVTGMFLEAGQVVDVRIEVSFNAKDPNVTLMWFPPSGDIAKNRTAEMEAIKNSDIVVLAMGYFIEHEHEGMDRDSLDLPPGQEAYVMAALKKNPKIVATVTSGSAVALNKMAAAVPAILMWWYQGEQGGNGIADVLLGEYNPAGRMPFTVYKSVADLPAFNDYEISRGRTYMFFKGQTLYPFGYGLSYTSFDYSGLDVKSSGDAVAVSFKVKNTGGTDGDEVAQMYVRDTRGGEAVPMKKLYGFKRVNVKQGGEQRIDLTFKKKDLSYWNESRHEFEFLPGEYEVLVGASSSDIRLKKSIRID